MANNKKKGGMPSKLPQPKQNYQLWIIITLVLVISSIFYLNNSNSLVEISERRFSEMALRILHKVKEKNRVIMGKKIGMHHRGTVRAPHKWNLYQKIPVT